jgi:hypothetical protein
MMHAALWYTTTAATAKNNARWLFICLTTLA